MSKYCSNCGRSSDGDSPCNCNTDTPVEENSYDTNDNEAEGDSHGTNDNEVKENSHSTNDNEIEAIDIISLSKTFLKNPVDTIINLSTNGNYKIGIFFVLIQALISSFIAMILVKSFFEFFFSGIPGLFSFEESRIPYFSIFCEGFVGIFIQFLLLVGIIHLFSKILTKKDASFKALVSTIGISSLPCTLCLVVALVILFISSSLLSLVISLIVLGSICSLILNYISIRETYKISENRLVYIVSISYFVYFIVNCIIAFLVQL